MDYPTLDQVRQLRDAEMATRADNRRPLLPLCCDILADMETPVSAYCKTARGPYSFLLESVAGGERIARYSFIGIDPYMVMKHDGEKAMLYRMQAGRNDEMTNRSAYEEIACYDPLEVIETELGQ